MSALVACSSDKPGSGVEEEQVGKLSLALRATAPSGSVFRLRNAFFEITDVRTGEFVQSLTTEALPDADELTTKLLTGSYTIRLFPGWFLERVSGPAPGGGAGGATSGGSGPIGVAGSKPLPVDEGAGGASAEEPDDGPFPVGGEPATGGTFGTGGSSTGSGGSAPDAEVHLLSDAVQFFGIFGGLDTFVSFQFQVGGEIVDFNHGKLHVGIGVVEPEPPCIPTEGATLPERLLMETNVDAVGSVSLPQVFEALVANGGHQGSGAAVYRQIFDSYASADLGQVPDAVHCGDESIAGVPTLNGFRIDCNRVERLHVDDMEKFFPTAFVNRMDLAPANGAHCGQQRMIFANSSLGRTFMIIEAQIPNPAPELGIDGCRPLAQFWLNQNSIASPQLRGERLRQAFVTGDLPELADAGFGPFFTAENLTVGSGQIRTNQFDDFPWTLREFKLAIDGNQLRAIPFPVAESPNGALWDEGSQLPQGEACRESFLSALGGVLTNDLSLMSFVVDQACKDAESRNDFSQDYASNMSLRFSARIQEELDALGSRLTPTDVANRARFAGSCIGCHNESQFSPLGDGIFAPPSEDFPQVLEFPVACSGGEQGDCFRTSSALREVFLPGRLAVMSNFLGFPIIPAGCQDPGGGVGGSSGMGTAGSFSGGTGPIPGGGATGVGGGAPAGGSMAGPGMPVPTDPKPAPAIVIELPSVDVPVEELQVEDQEIRDAYGDVTISGRSAKATH